MKVCIVIVNEMIVQRRPCVKRMNTVMLGVAQDKRNTRDVHWLHTIVILFAIRVINFYG